MSGPIGGATGLPPLLDPSWVRPFWLERQLDPDGPDVVCGADGPDGLPANTTHRDWVLIGNLASWHRAAVDPRGLVTPWDGAPSLDWWVGAEDRWHLPSRSVGVRQRLLDHAPVVETAMRVPGGDVLHRAYTVVAGPGEPGYVVVEIENRTAVPVAVALAVRPYGPLGAVPVRHVGFDPVAATVAADGNPFLLLPKPPAHAAASTAAAGDTATTVLAGAAGPPSAFDEGPRCDEGAATAAFVFPLTHTAVLRVVLPLAPLGRAEGGGRRGRAGRSSEQAAVAYPADVAPAASVARGWDLQTRRGARFEVPDKPTADLIDAARRHLLVLHGGEDLVSWPAQPLDLAEAATVLGVLGRYGFLDEAAQVLGTWEERQGLDGTFVGVPGRSDAGGAALAALADHWLLTRGPALAETLVGPVAKAVHWIEKRRTGRRPGRRPSAAPGLLPDGPGPAFVGGAPAPFADAAWSLRGLRGAAAMLEGTGQPEVAADARRFADGLDAAFGEALGAAFAACGGRALPAGPGRRDDATLLANLALGGPPAGPFAPIAVDDPRLAATLDAVRARYLADGGRAVTQVAGAAGPSPALTALLALAELEVGDRRALDRFSWLVSVAGDTARWPTAVHPRTRGGSAGVGDDPYAAALFLELVRRLLVREVPVPGTDGVGAGGLAVCSLVPDPWLGQGWEVHDAPTAFGTFGYAVRWHGDRPALLWELEPHDGVTSVRLTAPGLDPTWSSTEWRGEALLAPVAVPEIEIPDDEELDRGIALLPETFRPIPTAPPAKTAPAADDPPGDADGPADPAPGTSFS